MIIINKQEDMEKYYDEKTNTYVFNGDVTFTCDINIRSGIDAYSINANNIKAYDIKAFYMYARNINADNINATSINANDIYGNNIDVNYIIAQDISYYSFCIATNTFKCKKIVGRRENSIHKCLDNDIEFINDEDEE